VEFGDLCIRKAKKVRKCYDLTYGRGGTMYRKRVQEEDKLVIIDEANQKKKYINT